MSEQPVEKPEPSKRITAYLDNDEYIQFRMRLLQRGVSFSSWLRSKIKEELILPTVLTQK